MVYSGTGTWWGGVGRSAWGEARDQTMQAVEERRAGIFGGSSALEILHMHVLNPAQESKSAVHRIVTLSNVIEKGTEPFVCPSICWKPVSTLLTTAGLPRPAHTSQTHTLGCRVTR